MSALSGKHNGSILNDLGGLFGGGVDDSVMQDGAGILGHVFGNKQPEVENALSQKSGLDAGSVGQILKIAAPIVMGFLGKQTAQSNVSDSSGMNALLGSMLGGQPQENQSLITTLLDADGDGSILDDVAGMVMGSNYTWLNTIARPEGYYSQAFLENRNQLLVTNWNQRVLIPSNFDPNLYQMQIDYQSGIDYGYEVNYKLYNYFIYFQRKYNQRLGPFVPRI